MEMKTDSPPREQTESSGSRKNRSQSPSLTPRQQKKKNRSSGDKRRRSRNDAHKRKDEFEFSDNTCIIDSTDDHHYTSPSKKAELGAAIGALEAAERLLAMEKLVINYSAPLTY